MLPVASEHTANSERVYWYGRHSGEEGQAMKVNRFHLPAAALILLVSFSGLLLTMKPTYAHQDGVNSRSQSTVYSAEVTKPAAYQTQSLDAATATQEIELQAGWNMISSYLVPDDPQLETMLAGLGDDLVILKNGAGQVYWPAYGIN
jgi:hypothetical protein